VGRFDQVEPHVSAFRARLLANWLEADVGVVRAVSLNGSGLVVKGNPAGSSGLKGVVALGKIRNAGHPVDVMQLGEILDITAAEITGTRVAGGNVYATTTTASGLLTMTGGAGTVRIGHLVEVDRLIVRFTQDATAGAN
jgi:hypothetical protein